jgi:ABC-type transporter Mla subunit MlaD
MREVPFGDVLSELLSLISQLSSALEDPEFKEVLKSLQNAVHSVNTELSQKPIAQITKNIETSAASFRKAMNTFQETLEDYKKSASSLNTIMQTDIKNTILTIQDTASEISKLTKEIQNSLIPNQYQLSITLVRIEELSKELERTLHTFNNMVEIFQEQPAGFLFGKEKKNDK